MNLTEFNNNDLLSLFNYVGKKFNNWKELDKNWGVEIDDEHLDFPIGSLYARHYDQAGTEYWFYDGVLSYGVYVWRLSAAVCTICSVITIKKGKYIYDDSNFILEKTTQEFPIEPSVCSKLFSPILDLTIKEAENENDLVKKVSRLFEGFSPFAGMSDFFTLVDQSFFPNQIVNKCRINFEIFKGKIDEIYLAITDDVQKDWEETRER